MEAELTMWIDRRTDVTKLTVVFFSQFCERIQKPAAAHLQNVQKIRNDNKWVRKEETLAVNCRQVIWILIYSIEQYRWRYTSPWNWLQGIKRCSLKRQRPLFLLQNLLTASMHPRNSLPGYCSLFIQIDVLNHLAASLNMSKPVSQLRNHHGSLLWVMRRFVAFFEGTLISIVSSWMYEFRNWKTSSAWYLWPSVLGGKRRKCGVA